MSTEFKYDVFISYSSKDYMDEHKNVIPNNEVSKIMNTLKDAGITYWIDEEGIYSGDKFTEELPQIIKSAPIFVFLSTANANKSKQTSREIAIADEFGKYIIPVRIDMTPYNDKVLYRIADVSFIKYSVNPTKGREDLVKSIKAFLIKKKEDEDLRKKALDEQRKQQEEERKRQEEIGKIETEISALELQQIELKKNVLQKEQQLKLAQVDLQVCEEKIKKLQARLYKLGNSERYVYSLKSDKRFDNKTVASTNESSFNQSSQIKATKTKRTQIFKHEWHQLIRDCRKAFPVIGGDGVFPYDRIIEVLDINKLKTELQKMNVDISMTQIFECVTIGNLKKLLVNNDTN